MRNTSLKCMNCGASAFVKVQNGYTECEYCGKRLVNKPLGHKKEYRKDDPPQFRDIHSEEFSKLFSDSKEVFKGIFLQIKGAIPAVSDSYHRFLNKIANTINNQIFFMKLVDSVLIARLIFFIYCCVCVRTLIFVDKNPAYQLEMEGTIVNLIILTILFADLNIKAKNKYLNLPVLLFSILFGAFLGNFIL